jgi:hypothetical protein
VADAVHNWFSSAGGTSYTSYLWNGITTGVVTPGFGYPADPPFIDPRGGQTLINGLEGTVKSGAFLTLCEGFTDAAESVAYWRSEDATYYKYPNQRPVLPPPNDLHTQNAKKTRNFLDQAGIQASALQANGGSQGAASSTVC